MDVQAGSQVDVEGTTPMAGASLAAANRRCCSEKGVFVLNLLAGSGSGKTSVILSTIESLRDEFNIAVIEADAASKLDAARISSQGIAAVRIDASAIGRLESGHIASALQVFDLDFLDLIVIENPAGSCAFAPFDLGQHADVAIFAVSEGSAAPRSCPRVASAADAVILNKVDTMSQYEFDMVEFSTAVAELSPSAPVFPMSATKADGVDAWSAWLRERIESLQ